MTVCREGMTSRHTRNAAGMVLLMLGAACTPQPSAQATQAPDSRVVVAYDSASIGPNAATWNPQGIDVDGYRHANVFVEFEQREAQEEPLEVGVGFGPYQNGRVGTRNYFDFTGPGGGSQAESSRKPPTWISGSGRETWHGEQGISSYLVRVPVMGPFMWVYPQNNHAQARRFTIVVYLTKY